MVDITEREERLLRTLPPTLTLIRYYAGCGCGWRGAGPGGGAKGREEKMPFKQAGLYIIENVGRYLTAFYFYDVFFFS